MRLKQYLRCDLLKFAGFRWPYSVPVLIAAICLAHSVKFKGINLILNTKIKNSIILCVKEYMKGNEKNFPCEDR